MSEKLTNAGEVLFRQIHPSFVENGVPSSQPFKPTEKDQNQLSLDRSSLTTAAKSHALYLESGLSSEAVFGLTVGEFTSETINCQSDPLKGPPANPAHTLADYSAFTGNQQKNIAKRLKLKALARGRLHP